MALKHNAKSSFDVSADGRIALAEHLRKLPLGFFGRHDPGALTTMLLTDYTNVENTVGFYVPQLVSAVVLPVLIFFIMLFFSPLMALAMFVPLPLCFLIMWLSTDFQKRISIRHAAAREESAGRLQEYLLGMREIKAHNLGGARFSALEEAFARQKKESLRMEILVVPVVLVAIAALRSGLTLMLLAGAFLLVGGELSLTVFLLLVIGFILHLGVVSQSNKAMGKAAGNKELLFIFGAEPHSHPLRILRRPAPDIDRHVINLSPRTAQKLRLTHGI